jgi:hypothetical protein
MSDFGEMADWPTLRGLLGAKKNGSITRIDEADLPLTAEVKAFNCKTNPGP